MVIATTNTLFSLIKFKMVLFSFVECTIKCMHGTLDESTCQCTCDDGWMGLACSGKFLKTFNPLSVPLVDI